MSRETNTQLNLLNYDFIIYEILNVLSLSDLNTFSQLCNETQILCDFKKSTKHYTKNNIKRLYNYMTLPKVINLNISNIIAINENSYVSKFIKYPNIFKTFLVSATDDCDHDTIDSENTKCDICKCIQQLYIFHINGNKTFSMMSVDASYLSSIVMTLYH